MNALAPCYLYIFGDKGGPYKVGCSHDPDRRAKQIPAFSPGRVFCNKDTATILYRASVPGGVIPALIAEDMVVASLRSRAVWVGMEDRAWRRWPSRIEWSSADIRTIRRLIDTSIRLVWTPEVIAILISDAMDARRDKEATKAASVEQRAQCIERRARLRRLSNAPRLIHSRSSTWCHLKEWRRQGWIHVSSADGASAFVSITTAGLKEAAKK